MACIASSFAGSVAALKATKVQVRFDPPHATSRSLFPSLRFPKRSYNPPLVSFKDTFLDRGLLRCALSSLFPSASIARTSVFRPRDGATSLSRHSLAEQVPCLGTEEDPFLPYFYDKGNTASVFSFPPISVSGRLLLEIKSKKLTPLRPPCLPRRVTGEEDLHRREG